MKLFGIDVGHGNSLKDKLYWLVNGFMTNMGFVLWGGSPPPASAPTQTTVMNTNIPDYAQPYVMNMLNAAQAQVYNPSGTGFNAYTPYSNNPANYVAGFSPLQQQAQSSAANLQVPGAYNQAMGQTMGVNRQLGGLGQQMGMTGQNYANQATNPASVNAYMNPYIQASLAPQLQLANQQYGIAGQQEQSGATQAGAFGGSREALMNSLNAQNQMLAQNQLISQGYNTAFQNAQQAQQFGANLGLQGQQAQAQALASQMAGANQLAGLGGQELAAQQSILGTQAQQGAQQQTQQQNIINQAIQNYATAQQYPYMQLGVLNSMLRGLPMQQSTTSMYQAPPSLISQAAGLGTAGIGLAGMANATGILKAKGGVIKAKEGGVMKAAGGIPMSMFSPEQLNAVEQSQYASPLAKLVANGYQQEDQRLKSNPESPKILAQQSMQPMPPQDRMGVGAIATPPDLTTMKAAGGGLLAFAGKDDSLVPSPDDSSSLKLASQKEDPSIIKLLKSASGANAHTDDTPNTYPEQEKFTPTTINPDTGMFDISKFNKNAPVKPAPVVVQPSDPYDDFTKANASGSPTYSAPTVTAKSIYDSFKKSPQVSHEISNKAPVSDNVVTPITDPNKFSSSSLEQKMWEEYLDPKNEVSESLKAGQKHLQDIMEGRQKTMSGEALLRAGLGMMAGTSPYALVNIGKGAPEGLDFYSKQQAQNEADQEAINKYAYEATKADEDRHQKIGATLSEIAAKKEIAANKLKEDAFQHNMMLMLAQDKNARENLKMEGFQTPAQKSLQKSIVDPANKSAETAQAGINTLNLMEQYLSKAPDGPMPGRIAAGPIGRMTNSEGNQALNQLKMLKNSLVVELPKLQGRLNQSEFNALQEAIGDISNSDLTNQVRMQRIQTARQHLQGLIDKAKSINDEFVNTGKVNESLYGTSSPKNVIKFDQYGNPR